MEKESSKVCGAGTRWVGISESNPLPRGSSANLPCPTEVIGDIELTVRAHAAQRQEPGSPTQEASGWSHYAVVRRASTSGCRGWFTCQRKRFLVLAAQKGRMGWNGQEEIGQARGFPFFSFSFPFLFFYF